jgi:DNA-binding CsgD family transcriptional regulator
MRLSHCDCDRLQRTIRELHELDRMESFRQAVPALFLKLFPAQWFVVMDGEISWQERRIRMADLWESAKCMDSELVSRMERMAFDHPFSRYSFETSDPSALKFSDFYTMTQLRNSEIFNVFYRHLNIGRFLATSAFHPRGITTINAARAPGDPDFSERDRLLMNLLRPHFEIARHAAELNDARAASGAKPIESYGLSPRAQEVATWLARGKTSAEIASILSVRPRTIEKHMERILEKTGATNRTAAALLLTNSPRKA